MPNLFRSAPPGRRSSFCPHLEHLEDRVLFNVAPIAVNDAYLTNEDSAMAVGASTGVLANDIDPDSRLLRAKLVSGPAHGTLEFKADGSFVFTPVQGYSGTDTFTYRTNDGRRNSAAATVAITVKPVNDVPLAAGDAFQVNEDSTLLGNVLANDTDADGDPLSAALVSGPSHGVLTLNPNGAFSYAPTANFHGSDSFTYRALDPSGASSVATVAITVKPVNDVPVAAGDAFAVDENGTLLGNVLANDTDADGDPLGAALVSGPSHGVLTLNTNGTFSYTPNANFHGSDSFTYRVLDPAGASSVATVTLTVNQVSDFSAVTARLEESVTSGKLTGVGLIILDGDEVLYQEAFGNQTLGTQLFIASASKLTSATVMMTLVDDGLIGLDDPISKYLPQFTGSVGAITIRQLLSQTHGLPGNHRTLNAPGEDNGLTLEQCVNSIAADFASGRLRPVRPAGTEFEYAPGISYQIFGRIAEIVTGQTWDALWHERVGDPLQMTHSTYGTTDNPRLAGGMASTLADYGRLVQMFLNGGATPDGVRILSAAAVAEMLKNQVAGLPFNGSQAMHTEGYGLSWWHNDMNTVLSLPGAYGAIPWVDFSHGYAAFLLTYDVLAASVPVWEDIVPLIGAELGGAELGHAPLTRAVGVSAGLDSLTVSALTGPAAKTGASSTRQTSGYLADFSGSESSLAGSLPEPAGYFAGLRDSKPVATKGERADPFGDWIWRLDR